MRPLRFTTTAEGRPRGGITIHLPTPPAEAWGDRDRYDVAGTIGGMPMRGPLRVEADGSARLELGPSWCRDPRVGAGRTVEVVMDLEGPQVETMDAELAAALLADPVARRAFEGLPTFDRKNLVRPIETAKRPETKARRIAAVIDGLLAHRPGD